MRSKIKSTLLVMLTSLIMSCSTPTHKPETTTPTTQIPRLYCLERIYNQQFPITSRDEFFESINRLVEYREAQYLGAFHSQNPFLSLSLSYPLFESCVQELSDIGISEGYLIVPLDSVLLDTIAREEAIREAFFGEKAEIEREFFLMSADLGIGSLGRVFEVATSLDDIYTNISDGLTSYDKFVIGAIIVDFIPGVETDLFKGRFLQLLKKHGVLVGVRKGDGLYDFYSILRGAEPNVTKYSVLLGRVQKTNSSLEEAALAVEEAIIGAQSVRVEIGSGNRLGFLGHLDDPKLKTPTLRIGLERSSGVLRTLYYYEEMDKYHDNLNSFLALQYDVGNLSYFKNVEVGSLFPYDSGLGFMLSKRYVNGFMTTSGDSLLDAIALNFNPQFTKYMLDISGFSDIEKFRRFIQMERKRRIGMGSYSEDYLTLRERVLNELPNYYREMGFEVEIFAPLDREQVLAIGTQWAIRCAKVNDPVVYIRVRGH